jgi:hypothetical protein
MAKPEAPEESVITTLVIGVPLDAAISNAPAFPATFRDTVPSSVLPL